MLFFGDTMKSAAKKRTVKVHSCNAKTIIRNVEFDTLNPDRLYYSDDPEFKSFKALPLKCRCKRMITEAQKKVYLEQRKAIEVYKPRENEDIVEGGDCVEENIVVMPLDRSKTPRVDLVTKADIERAYIDKQTKYVRLIEEIHNMIMSERVKLMVPFREDPCNGRLLFPFGPDQRTFGGLG